MTTKKNTITMRSPPELKKFLDDINTGIVKRQIELNQNPKILSYPELLSKIPKVPSLKEFMIKEIKLKK